MADKEKVIKGLSICRHKMICQETCMECPYIYDKRSKQSNCEGVLHDDALSLLKEHEWHTLTEDRDGIIHGLPGDDGQYLMTDGKDIWIDDYVDGVADGIILDSGRDIREITAWMYMPELPKKDTMML